MRAPRAAMGAPSRPRATEGRAFGCALAFAVVMSTPACDREKSERRGSRPASTPDRGAAEAAPAPAGPRAPAGKVALRYVAGSTRKVEQVIGDLDPQTSRPTRNRTKERFTIAGTDLGYSFEHAGKVVFLFGDTLGKGGGDAIAFATATSPEGGLPLTFFTEPSGRYLRVAPEGVSMKGFEVPVSGISIDKTPYVVVKTNHTEGAHTDISVLTRWDDAAGTFTKLREISRLPEGRFVKMSLREPPRPLAGLPEGGPFVLMFGSGRYRESDAYLAVIPRAEIASGKGTKYFAGLSGGVPRWSDVERDAQPIVRHPTIGDLSVTWAKDVGLWVMTYDSREPRGVLLRSAEAPWGPWSEPQRLFHAKEDRAVGAFIHAADDPNDDHLAGPMIGKDKKDDPKKWNGAAYAPYVIERFSRTTAGGLELSWLMSTWNPYVVVLMRSTLAVERAP